MKHDTIILVGDHWHLLDASEAAMIVRGLRGRAEAIPVGSDEVVKVLEKCGRGLKQVFFVQCPLSADREGIERVLSRFKKSGISVEWVANWAGRRQGEFERELRGQGLIKFMTEHGDDVGGFSAELTRRFGIDMKDLDGFGDLVWGDRYIVSSPTYLELVEAGWWFHESYGQDWLYSDAVRLMAEKAEPKGWGARVGEAIEHFRRFGKRGLLGRSPQMRKLREVVRQLRDSPDVRVMLLGETGTGKETVAMQIHYGSSRRKGRFVSFNCAAMTRELMEDRLFGHEKGAFTGAIAEADGLFKQADGGTLFLDEIGELSLEAQAMLLRVLEEGAFRRVGGKEDIYVNVRLITATNRNLADMVGRGEFRQDLYYRLNIVKIRIPPLREHLEDISSIVGAWNSARQQANEQYLEPPSDEQISALMNYDYPGNVRELLNLLNQSVALKITDFAKLIEDNRESFGKKPQKISSAEGVPDDLEEATRMHIRRVYDKYGQNLTKAAEALKVSRNTVRKYL